MKKLTPDIYVNNIYDISYKKLKIMGIKLLCFDLDNTLDIPDNITVIKDSKLENLFKELKEDFEILIVSNNTIENRVNSFAKLYDLNYIEAMKKPFMKNYNHPIILKYQKKEIVFIGDKVITDVLGARKYGSYSILVDALCPGSNKWYSKVMHVSDKIFSVFSKVEKEKYFDEL